MGYITLNDVSKTYTKQKNNVDALNKVNIDFERHGMYFITGYSGSGKTTLLNVIAGLLEHDSGEVLIDSQSLKNFDKTQLNEFYKKEIGLLFQEVNHIKNLTVMKSIQLGLDVENKDEMQIIEVGKKLNLDRNLFYRRVEELSMGQKQRAALTRILIKDPKVILADEPTASLDEETGIKLMNILKRISKDKLVIVVSHDLSLAKKFADVIHQLENGILVNGNQSNLISDNHKINYIDDISGKNETSSPLLNMKDIFSLSSFYALTNKTRYTISTILLSISLILIFSMISLFNYNVNSAISRYLLDENIDWVIPYIHEEIDLGYGEIEENNVFNGTLVYQSLNNQEDDIYKIYVNQLISLYSDETIDGETNKLNTNVISYNNFDIEIIGDFPVSDDDVMLSEYLYKEMFGNDVLLPKIVYVNSMEMNVTGIIPKENLLLRLSDFDNEYNNEFVKYSVFIPRDMEYNKQYLINQDSSSNGVNVYANYDDYKDYINYELSSGEIAITSKVASEMGLSVGDYLTFDKTLSSSEMSLNDTLNDRMRVVEVIDSSESTIVLAADDYELIIDFYNTYFFYDYLLVNPEDMDSMIDVFYSMGGFFEPGTELILEQTDFITRVQTLFFPLLAVCILITILSVLNLITSLLNKRGNEFGLMRSLGVKNLKLYLIFIFQATSMFILSLLISYVVVIQWIRYLNKTLTVKLISEFSFIKVSQLNIALMSIILLIIIIGMTISLCHNYLRKSIFNNIYK